ncbi:hypothetical protein E2320_009696 [Naja naja]|nr:hypothetical protein E2320_009696 [Naja naja]
MISSAPMAYRARPNEGAHSVPPCRQSSAYGNRRAVPKNEALFRAGIAVDNPTVLDLTRREGPFR